MDLQNCHFCGGKEQDLSKNAGSCEVTAPKENYSEFVHFVEI